MAGDEFDKVELPAIEQLNLWVGHMQKVKTSLR